jgi:NAD-dependent deacetylase
MSTWLSRRLLERLSTAEWITVLTGAGISAESGVPTFRSADGIWAKYRPEELATMEAFLRNPELVWEWYAQRKRVIADVQPNAGHRALVRMEELYPQCTIVTQNIDNLHRRAGSKNVVELHGNIERNYCVSCGTAASNELVLRAGGVPRCERCGGTIRPDVVWFGEMLPEDQWNLAVRAAESSDVFFSIGTSAVVYPAASLPLLAKQRGALLVEINPEPTPVTERVDEFLQGQAGTILPELVSALSEKRA